MTEMALLALGVLLGLSLAVAGFRAILDFAGDDAAFEPAVPPYDFELAHEMLLSPAAWPRNPVVGGRPAPAPPALPPPAFAPEAGPNALVDPIAGGDAEGFAYNRPLDIQVAPGGGILPPPRRIRGINNER